MFPTPPALRAIRRLALTTKQVNKGYYKGNRTGSMGRHTKHGGYEIEWGKVRTYVVPADLDDFAVISASPPPPVTSGGWGKERIRGFWADLWASDLVNPVRLQGDQIPPRPHPRRPTRCDIRATVSRYLEDGEWRVLSFFLSVVTESLQKKRKKKEKRKRYLNLLRLGYPHTHA